MKKPLCTIALLSVTALSGCSLSPGELRAKYSPDVVHTSAKHSKEIAMCVADKWENSNVIGASVRVSFRPTSFGYTVSKYLCDELHYLIDITDTSTGTQTKAWRYKVMSLGRDSNMSAISDCQL